MATYKDEQRGTWYVSFHYNRRYRIKQSGVKYIRLIYAVPFLICMKIEKKDVWKVTIYKKGIFARASERIISGVDICWKVKWAFVSDWWGV